MRGTRVRKPKVSLLSIIKEALAVRKEEQRYRDAVEALQRDEWSVDLMVHLLQKVKSNDVKITLHNQTHNVSMTFEKVAKSGPVVQPPKDQKKAFYEYIGIDGEDIKTMEETGYL